MPAAIEQPHAPNPALGWPFVVVKNDIRIKRAKLNMGDPALVDFFAQEFFPGMGIIDPQERREPFLLYALINVVIRLARELLFAIKSELVRSRDT